MEGTISIDIKGKTAFISFFHPASNSFPSLQLQKLSDAFYDLGKNKEISLIVLKSEGEGAFCAGASFDELLAVSNLEEGNRFFSGFANVINAMRKCPKLIIGRIQGKAVGGGVGLISACDFVFATKNAAVKLSEIAIGIGPFVIEPAVSRKIGKMPMAEMTLQPTEWRSAEWAFQNKLYNKTVETIEELDKEVENYIYQLENYNSEALFEMKKVLWEGTENWDHLLYERAAISGRLVLSEFTKKALNQFKKS